ncbi:MAG: DUF2264 domain-containing protein [Colwellia sp.]
MNKLIVLYVVILTTFQVDAKVEQPLTTSKITSNIHNTIFEIKKPNYELSPYTGMTKQHWKDAALYMLEGAFSYVDNLDAPMKFPKLPGKSYPHNDGQIPTEKLEGLCRTLFIAAPLLLENPDLVINNISVAAYYRHQIIKLIEPSNAAYIEPRAKDGGPSQNLVEFGALAISLTIAPDVLWQPLSQQQKDALARTMLSYGDGPTVPSNWKFFNIYVLSFFKDQGYTVNDKLLTTYLEKSLEHYRSNGWYNDNPAYDYYSMWAFQMYGMLWSEFYGKKYYPEYAKKFQKNFADVKDNYPYMFSRDGEMIMWGRSISYRFGAIIPFPLMGFENNNEQKNTNFGWMRRISSGVLKQFLQHPDFMQDNVPTLGFYGHFEPAVQGYSCRGSVFWMGKAFLGLLIPDDNPFWQATENNGAWDNELTANNVHHKYQTGSQILITDYPNIGAAELRSWSNVPIINAWEKFRGSENYNRLSYNSAFPWQADGESGEVAMNYVFKNHQYQWEALRMFTFNKYEQGIYYRNAVLETNQNIKIQLADMPLANGILRVDKLTGNKNIDLHLGHYALPQLANHKITHSKRKVGQYTATIIDNGQYQLAMIPMQGWGETQIITAKNLHPESINSTVINVMDTFKKNSAITNKVYITLMLWKKSGEIWTDDELIPVRNIELDKTIIVNFKNAPAKTITY